jgi:ribose-phosphate pyrophosphokinase
MEDGALEFREVRLQPLIVPGSAHRSLAEALAHELQAELASCLIEPFPDGEQEVEIRAHVRGRPVFIVQPLGAPVGEHLLELLLLADACRRAGAGSVTAIVPYVGYARQDRVIKEGQPLGARVLAEVLGTGSFSQVIAVDLHSPVVASCIHAPVVHLTAIPDMVEALRPDVPDDAVVVSPDLGAVKVAESYARPLGLPLAVLHKIRVSGTAVAVHGVVGDVRGKRPIVVDDMISTGATVEAAMDALLGSGCRHEFIVVATHGLFVGKAVERLNRPEMLRALVTDSLPLPNCTPARLKVVRLAPLLAEAVRRIVGGRPLNGLLAAR